MSWFKKTLGKMRNAKTYKNISYGMNKNASQEELAIQVENVLHDCNFWESEYGSRSLFEMFMKNHVSLVLEVLKQHPSIRLSPKKEQEQAFVDKINVLVECLKRHTAKTIFKLHTDADILKVQGKLKNHDSISMQKFMAQSKQMSLMNMYFGKIKNLDQLKDDYYLSTKERWRGVQDPDCIQGLRVDKSKDIGKYIYEPYLERAQSKSNFDSEKEAERLLGNMLLTQINSNRMSNHLKSLLFKKSVSGLSGASSELVSLYVMSKFWLDAEYLDKHRAYEELKTYFSKQVKSIKLQESIESAIQLVNTNIPEGQRLEFCQKNLGFPYGCLCLIERDWGKVHQFFDVHSEFTGGEERGKTMVDFMVNVVVRQDARQYEKDEKEWKELLTDVFAKDREPRKLALKISKALEAYSDLDPALKPISLLKEKVYAFTIKEVCPATPPKTELKPPVWRF